MSVDDKLLKAAVNPGWRETKSAIIDHREELLSFFFFAVEGHWPGFRSSQLFHTEPTQRMGRPKVWPSRTCHDKTQRRRQTLTTESSSCLQITSCAAGKTASTCFANTLPAWAKTYRQRASPASAPETRKPCHYTASLPICMHRIRTGDSAPTFGQLLAETGKVGLLEVPVEVWQHAHQVWHLGFSFILVYVHCLLPRKVWILPGLLTWKYSFMAFWTCVMSWGGATRLSLASNTVFTAKWAIQNPEEQTAGSGVDVTFWKSTWCCHGYLSLHRPSCDPNLHSQPVSRLG